MDKLLWSFLQIGLVSDDVQFQQEAGEVGNTEIQKVQA
jgi:hypothetical protein